MTMIMTISYYNQNVLLILWYFGLFAIPGFTILKVLELVGFPPMKYFHEMMYGEDNE